ncbi:hypothetical protein GCM10011384_33070 [Psychrobacillus lasiicapitis]|nr:hypothetical protein GCM10011384_33070 [Psychrobacillus lasiicapitis]
MNIQSIPSLLSNFIISELIFKNIGKDVNKIDEISFNLMASGAGELVTILSLAALI